MIEKLDNLPDGVIGFEAVGEVHAADDEDVLIPAVDAAATAGGVRLVFVLGDRFTGYRVGAGFEDLRLASPICMPGSAARSSPTTGRTPTWSRRSPGWCRVN